MSRDTTVIAFRQPDNINDPLTELAREGARRMLAQVLFAEADAFVAMWKDLKLPDGRDRIVRHGHGPDRTIQTGVGPVEVRRAKVRDRQGKRKSASARRSSILPSRRNSRLLRIPAGAHATAFFTVRRRRSRFEIIRNPARNGSARRARTRIPRQGRFRRATRARAQRRAAFPQREAQQRDACLDHGPGCQALSQRQQPGCQAQLQGTCFDGEPAWARRPLGCPSSLAGC